MILHSTQDGEQPLFLDVNNATTISGDQEAQSIFATLTLPTRVNLIFGQKNVIYVQDAHRKKYILTPGFPNPQAFKQALQLIPRLTGNSDFIDQVATSSKSDYTLKITIA
ncbi:hypothetical protein [Levilactobacillus bambusae]|uniref:Uncharacterized protein n=1 Tax=Levilactobacillus bambusae TaxID=2024736 RepID=A0A2V1N109_9LACO|nr:hypothetical protein [Levilactobacillus bambusae]PWG00703.1 hypothetical protein DCM90_00570 [Levilactobacillus bambusae]